MEPKKLDAKMKELHYNPYDKESRKKFFDELGEHDRSYNRMKAVQSTGTGWLLANALLNPTAFDEAMQQSLDPNAEYDPFMVNEKFLNDQVANALIGKATGAKTLGGMMLGTAGGEFERQAMNKYIDPESEFNVGPVVAAPVAAGVTSGGVRGVGRIVSRVRFPGFQGFGRGMMKGARGANEFEAQKEALKRMLIDTRSQVGKTAANSAQQAEMDANREVAQNTLGLLGFNEIPLGEAAMNNADVDDIVVRGMMNAPTGQRYSMQQMLGTVSDNVTPITNRQVSEEIDRVFKQPFNLYKSDDPYSFKIVTEPLSEMPQPITDEALAQMTDAEAEAAIRQNLMDMADWARRRATGEATEADAEALARSQDAYVKRIADIKSNPYLSAKWEREANAAAGGSNMVKRAILGDAAGNGAPYAVGDITSGVLGTVEPVTKWSPWPIVQALYGGNFEQAKRDVAAKTKEYQNASWYKKLKRANPQAAAAYDAVMKEKEAEE